MGVASDDTQQTKQTNLLHMSRCAWSVRSLNPCTMSWTVEALVLVTSHTSSSLAEVVAVVVDGWVNVEV
ncbi:hypothetical protein PIB30_009712 [Stylosanthes scabra]|uniref:Uncharacterized protein n=1 Tax=Stylosanthes scabra TaxID=79078 RepID=A0ABU6V721_9FABA|nr:hypothetical protein [Stylosanthes scabra]